MISFNNGTLWFKHFLTDTEHYICRSSYSYPIRSPSCLILQWGFLLFFSLSLSFVLTQRNETRHLFCAFSKLLYNKFHETLDA